MSQLKKNTEYHELIERIGVSYQLAKRNIVTAVNTEMLKAYWEIGKHIVDFEQGGKLKAEYGKALLVNLSKDLSLKFGRGFSRSNLNYMRLLYSKYQKCETLSHKLSWSHYYELLKVEDDLARTFYENQAITDNWTIRELKRQKQSGLFHRLAIGKNKDEILKLSKEGQIIESEEKDDIMVEYAMLNDHSNLVVSKYQLYLPDIEQLKNKVREIIER